VHLRANDVIRDWAELPITNYLSFRILCCGVFDNVKKAYFVYGLMLTLGSTYITIASNNGSKGDYDSTAYPYTPLDLGGSLTGEL
jgi:hypothetical protein